MHANVTRLVETVANAPDHASLAGLVPLTWLREQFPTWTTGQFNANVREARRAGLLTATALEARYGLSVTEQAAAIPEDGQLLGFLSLRS